MRQLSQNQPSRSQMPLSPKLTAHLRAHYSRGRASSPTASSAGREREKRAEIRALRAFSHRRCKIGAKWEQFPCISLLNRPEFSGFWPRTEPDPGRWAHNNFFLPHQTDRFALILEAMAPENDSEPTARKLSQTTGPRERTNPLKTWFSGTPPASRP